MVIPLDMYKELVALSKLERRTISGQLCYSYEAFKQANLSTKDQAFLEQEVRKREAANAIQ